MPAQRIMHIITTLDVAGAQMMLYKLLTSMERERFEPEVVVLTDEGPMSEKLCLLGVPVRALGMRRGVPNPIGIARLVRWLRCDPPQVIQTWLYHANLVGGLAAKLAGRIPVAWGLRHSNLDPKRDKKLTVWTDRVCARMSALLCTRIVCCSEASLRAHAELGYATNKTVVIPNGFDTTTFKPDADARLTVRKELGISEHTFLIGLIGRFQAAARLHESWPHVHFLLCGDDISWDNSILVKMIEVADLHAHFHLLGRRHDIARLTASLDIASLSSSDEAFPNVVGEAMACGVPCVVTDVGDARLIVADTGKVVPPRNPSALAQGWDVLIKMDQEGRYTLGLAARQRIQEHFSLPIITTHYTRLYEELTS
jgi:glycosyltransferase involved in cell wall biosynthesis